jgi:hypothetical protein
MNQKIEWSKIQINPKPLKNKQERLPRVDSLVPVRNTSAYAHERLAPATWSLFSPGSYSNRD